MTESPTERAVADTTGAPRTGLVPQWLARWMTGADRRRRSQLVRSAWSERALAVTFRLPWLIPLVAFVAMLATAVTWPRVFAAPRPVAGPQIPPRVAPARGPALAPPATPAGVGAR